MRSEITMDGAGRVIIPKPIRESLRLSAGDALGLQQVGDQLVLTPIRPNTPLVKKRGIWIYMPNNALPENAVLDAIDEMREERIRELG